MVIRELLNEIRRHGDRGAVVPFSRLADLKRDMLDLKRESFRPSWTNRMINWITGEGDRFLPADLRLVPRSILSVVMSGPKKLLRFSHRTGPVSCIVPPHFTGWEANNARVLRYIGDYLAPHGYSVR